MMILFRGSALLFVSGMCALIYQSVWLRELRVILGASTPATSTVLSIFMGGMGFGALWVGRRVDHEPRPLRLYGMLECAVAVTAALSPLFLEVVARVYMWTGGSPALGSFALPLRVLLSAVVLGGPALLMGGTLPAMGRALTSTIDLDRRWLAVVYGVNTLGALVGVLATTFALFEHIGLRATLWGAAAMNLAVGVFAVVADRRVPSPEALSAHATASGAPEIFSLRPSWAPTAALVCGFSFLGFELVWYRALAPLLGGTTYSFSLIIAVALAGIGLGGLLYAFLGRTPSWTWVAATMVLEALCMLAPFTLGDDLPFLVARAREWAQVSSSRMFMLWACTAAVFVLPAAVISGYQFPALIALAGRGVRGVGADTGRVYAANTVGAILGSTFVGFVGLPVFGSWPSAQLAALLMAAAGLALLVKLERITLVVVCTLALLGMARSPGPSEVWRATAVGAGRSVLSASSWNEREALVRNLKDDVTSLVDGVESTVAVTNGDGFALLNNGKSDGSSIGDAMTVVGAVLIPALTMERPPRTAFVVGWGIGQSAGWLGAVPSIERVDVAEIEQAVIDGTRVCEDTNRRAQQSDKIHIHIGDGRELLQVSSQHYDLIMSEPSNPYRAGIAGFYSTDFYALAIEKLSDDGVFAQWLQAYEVQASTVQTAVASFKAVFPHAEIWSLSGGDLLLLGTRKPRVLDIEAMRARFATAPFQEAFQRIFFFERADDVLALHVGTDVLTTALSRSATQLNTDDRPVLEYAFARTVGLPMGPSKTRLLRDLAHDLGAARPAVRGEPDWARVDATQRALNAEEAEGTDDVPLAALIQAQQQDAPPQALERLGGFAPLEAAAVRAIRLSARQPTVDASEGRAALAALVDGLRRDPWLHPNLRKAVGPAVEALARGGGEGTAALFREPFAGGRLERARRRALLTAHMPAQDPSCVEDHLRTGVIWELNFLLARHECFANAGLPEAAEALRALEVFRAHEPAGFELATPPEAPSL